MRAFNYLFTSSIILISCVFLFACTTTSEQKSDSVTEKSQGNTENTTSSLNIYTSSNELNTSRNSAVVTDSITYTATPDASILLAQLPEQKEVIYFDNMNYELSVKNQQLLDPIALRLKLHLDSYLIVIGHSDDAGSKEENLVLSFERAFSVAIYISSVFGIEEERIQIIALGDDELISNGNSEQERRLNRRVEVISPKAIVRTLNTTP
ncbi:OmpA family protein [Photobacterium frigidiphilum]|uniref:OmpA family protein n=1 Tax=Photobacterium frigidiphilum TaxID=264736 RepID=A0A2T3J800_9GAMM|nr:OmpA family protein [Photobacterium frigidiphilum]PSU44896.1 OmpA family protein [Photobacterium frigidiphilum]